MEHKNGGLAFRLRTDLGYFKGVKVPDEHDDDLASTVETGQDMEIDDYPKTSEDFTAREEEEGGAAEDAAAKDATGRVRRRRSVPADSV